MKKKITLVMCIALIFALAGCDKKQAETQPSNGIVRLSVQKNLPQISISLHTLMRKLHHKQGH